MVTRALLVGIANYQDPTKSLPGVNHDIASFVGVLSRFGVTDLRVLRDENATSESIRYALQNILRSSSQGDTVIFYYSGHGILLAPDMAAVEEPDGRDQAIVPYEGTLSSLITDNWMNNLTKLSLPNGVFYWSIFDSCYSGDMFKAIVLTDGATAKELRVDQLLIDRLPPRLGRIAPSVRGFSGSVVGGYVYMGASEPDKTALMLNIGGVKRSVFTWAIEQAAFPNIDVRTFANEVKRIQAQATDHHRPQIMTTPQWFNRPLFT